MLEDIQRLRTSLKNDDAKVSSELIEELEKSIAIKKEERRLLSLERDCERLEDLHENIEWDTNDQKVQLIKKRLEGIEDKEYEQMAQSCQLTHSVLQDAVKSVQI